jgi:glucose-1-phosphate thymidylyltransferase
MIAVLLCAGFATRMYPLTENFPKPLLKVADRPVIDYLAAEILRLQGIREVHLVTNDRFLDHFQRWQCRAAPAFERRGRRLVVHNDGATDNDHRLGASADLQLVLRSLPDAVPALVSAGDNIYRFAIAPLWDRFCRSDAHHIVVLPENDPEKLRRTGVPVLGENNRVRRMHEKPVQPPANAVCPPLYFLQPSARSALDRFLVAGGNRDAPGHFIDYLCRTETVHGFKLAAARLDIGDMQSYRAADRILRNAAGDP